MHSSTTHCAGKPVGDLRQVASILQRPSRARPLQPKERAALTSFPHDANAAHVPGPPAPAPATADWVIREDSAHRALRTAPICWPTTYAVRAKGARLQGSCWRHEGTRSLRRINRSRTFRVNVHVPEGTNCRGAIRGTGSLAALRALCLTLFLALAVGFIGPAPATAVEAAGSTQNESPDYIPATDRGRVLELWKAGGPGVRAAAEVALLGPTLTSATSSTTRTPSPSSATTGWPRSRSSRRAGARCAQPRNRRCRGRPNSLTPS